MRRLLAIVAVVTALAAPSAALAADPTAIAPAPPLGGAWRIVAIETPGASLKIQGKLGIGPDLYASVGCNSMSAPVRSFDGTHLEIGPLATTEMACPGDVGTAEGLLAKVLGAGSLTFTPGAISSSAGRIDLASAEPPQPVPTAGSGGGTDGGTGTGPGGVTPDQCAKVLGAEWVLPSFPVASAEAGGGSSGSGGGSSGSGSGSSGSGGTSSGSGGSVPGSEGSASASIGVATVTSPPIEVAPPPSVAVDATGAPAPVPAVTPDAVPLPAGTPIPVDPVPIGSGIVPLPPVIVGSPAPAPDASVSVTDLCRALLARMKAGPTSGGAPGAVDSIGKPEAAADQHAFSAGPVSSDLVVGLLLGALAGLLAGVAVGWRERGRRGQDAPG